MSLTLVPSNRNCEEITGKKATARGLWMAFRQWTAIFGNDVTAVEAVPQKIEKHDFGSQKIDQRFPRPFWWRWNLGYNVAGSPGVSTSRVYLNTTLAQHRKRGLDGTLNNDKTCGRLCRVTTQQSQTINIVILKANSPTSGSGLNDCGWNLLLHLLRPVIDNHIDMSIYRHRSDTADGKHCLWA